jgi:hypothetical protein
MGMQALSLFYQTEESREGVKASWKSARRNSAEQPRSRPMASVGA